MARCAKCFQYFPPNFMREIPESKEGDLQCIFCMVGKDELTYDTDKGKTGTYTKKQCVEDYKIFLKKIKEKPKIARTLAKQK